MVRWAMRLTLDTHTLATEAKRVDNLPTSYALMLLLSLAIGVGADPHLIYRVSVPAGNNPFLLCQQTGAGKRQRR